MAGWVAPMVWAIASAVSMVFWVVMRDAGPLVPVALNLSQKRRRMKDYIQCAIALQCKNMFLYSVEMCLIIQH